MSTRHARPAVLVAILFLPLLSTPAHAQHPVGWLVTLLPHWNAMFSARLDRQGIWHWAWGDQAMEVQPSNNVKVINTAGGFLVYDQSTGKAQITRVLQTGQLSRAGKYNWNPGWNIIGTGTFLVFYNLASQSGAVGHITAEGAFVLTQYFPPRSMGAWDHVVATDNNVIFYNSDSGWAAIGYINAYGYWNEVSGTYLAAGCFALAGIGNYLLCSNPLDQTVTVYDIEAPGTALLTHVATTTNPYFRMVRHGSNVALLGFAPNSLAIAHVDQNGLFVMTHEQELAFSTPNVPEPSGADLLFSTGDMLLFYRQYGGGAMVGHVDHAGVFQPLQTMDLFPSGVLAASGLR